MSECRCCGESYSLIAYATRSISLYAPMIDMLNTPLPVVPSASLTEHREKLARTLVEQLRHDLTSALELAQTGLCGLCAIAAQPTACGTCHAVALGGHHELVRNNTLQAELQRRSAMLVERGITSAWHARKAGHGAGN